ncbi:hypothetical protein KR222_003293 [Zaprionus bogoriensis]|nr:hypothetical protein KR222_003293 [Zaprionus bogoriensis]
MASEIAVVNIGNFEKIQNFLNDTAYKEILENSENFNTRLCIERRLRMPFLDPQTGVAQTHCALFMKRKQRMPGFRHGQIYTYPSARWRKPKRQYLLNPNHSYRTYQYREHHLSHQHQHQHQHQHHHVPTSGSGAVGARDHHQPESAVIAATDGNSMGASGDNDSKDSHANAEKDWFHEDIDSSHYHHVDDYEDDFDSDNDFDESYSSRGKRKRGSRPRRTNTNVEGTPKRGRKGGGIRRRNATDGDAADRRRRGASNSANTSAAAAAAAAAVAHAASTAAAAAATGLYATHSNSASPIPIVDETSQSALVMTPTLPTSYEKSSLNDAGASNDSIPLATMASMGMSTTSAATPAIFTTINTSPATPLASPKKHKLRVEREVAQPSPYCDFCLGDQRENKKTNMPEELVSCSDCGRSGHPSCLQFTPNMIISVKRYRWQCIECKYCSICGTSDNDDQLLFCDDCDRGYHMYCLSPPLVTPPEGSWSCKLCVEEFHKHK